MKNEKGFTLIELVIVISIIGVLAAIGIPQFASYRARAFDATVQTALREATLSQEAYFIDNNTYSSTLPVVPNVQFSISSGSDSFAIVGKHRGSETWYEVTGPGGTVHPLSP